jgi:hypothetical protein
MGKKQDIPPLNGLLRALQEHEIRFLIVGMTSAVIHGGPFVTLDVDIWIDLPERQYMRAMNLSHKLGGELLGKCLTSLNNVMVNFIYSVHGLKSFRTEYKGANWYNWQGTKVAVLPLERLIASKEFIRRDKDLAVLPSLKRFLLGRKTLLDE